MDVDDSHPPDSSNLGKRPSNDDWEQQHHTPKSARSVKQPNVQWVDPPAQSQRALMDRLNNNLQNNVSTQLAMRAMTHMVRRLRVYLVGHHGNQLL